MFGFGGEAGFGGRRLGSRRQGRGGSKPDSEARTERVPLLGVMAALSAATLSSFAGVYFEALVKGSEVSPPSLWVRNVQLCIFTIPLAGLAVAIHWQTIEERGFTYGLDIPTLILIMLNASGGMLVAAVIKYGDSILKNFTTSCSVILGTLISVVLFDFVLTVQFAWGSALVASSAYAYVTAPPSAAVKPPPPSGSGTDEYKPLAGRDKSVSSDDKDDSSDNAPAA